MFAAYLIPRATGYALRHPVYKSVHLVLSRSVRSAIERPPPLTERLKLLAGPILFTTAVGVGTYALSEANKPPSSHFTPKHKRKKVAPELIIAIIGANVLVFGLWRLGSPAVLNALNKYMLSNLYGEARTLSMLGSTFSHSSAFHLFFNMYVLFSLTALPIDSYQFLHLYTTGGLVAALGSYINCSIRCLAMSSLGASGAILALIGYTVAKFPEARFSVLLVDQIYPHSFTASTAFWAIAGFDTCGLLLGWKLFDHAAHLFGICYGRLASEWIGKKSL